MILIANLLGYRIKLMCFLNSFTAKAICLVACHGEAMVGFPKGRRTSLTKGGVNAPP